LTKIDKKRQKIDQNWKKNWLRIDKTLKTNWQKIDKKIYKKLTKNDKTYWQNNVAIEHFRQYFQKKFD